MPSIRSSPISTGGGDVTPQKRRLRSNSASSIDDLLPSNLSPLKSKSPRQSVNDSPHKTSSNVNENNNNVMKSPKKKLLDIFMDKPIWNPTDMEQLSRVKEALHVSTAPTMIVCREDEQRRIVEFCRKCVEEDKSGSLYICGCPGTGKSLSMDNVKGSLTVWARETGGDLPDVLNLNCTSLSSTSEIFNKILEKSQPNMKVTARSTPLRQLQQLFSQKQPSADSKMMLLIADELDYLITKDRVVLHDLFMLTTLPFSKLILIGIANAIDLADRFLPKLQSLNCKPMVVTFRAYSMEQIIIILKQRLMELSYTVFQPQALELCARKVAAASGDMRKALGICRGAIEMLESELRESTCPSNLTSMVRVDHMAMALSRAYKSPIVDTVQSLPQHQQIILCSAVKLFRRGKKDTTIGELNKFYIDDCKSTKIPPVGIMELSCMCRVLGDQGILKLGQSRDDKLRRVTLQVDEADIMFALQKAYVIHWVRMDQYSSVDEAFKDGTDRLETLVSRVHDIVPPKLSPGSIKLYTSLFGPSLKNSNMTTEAYKEAVLQALEHILAGDIFQIVLSQRFERRTFADPFEVYRAQRIVNPSPYMTYLQARGCILVASSPEILTRVKKRKVTNRPLAGTIRRGKTPKEDYMLENQLLNDEKQCAEHIMLVDLGRNDVGKVSKPGSVNVEKLMNVERYSHVMHISSTVTGELLDELSTWDALRAALPVGTVSGAPKVKAMELIDQLEVTRRGPYSGGLEELRTIVFPTAARYDTMYSYRDVNKRRDWVAHLQAGAGIVADSDPADEQRECENKAAGLARAIDLAESSFVHK